VKAPKIYFLDTGLCAYLSEWSSPQTLEAGAMSGAILETYVFSEVLKSWWNRGKQPQLYYYRDKEGREIDLLIMQDRKIHPIEVKKSGSPRPDAVASFAALERFGASVGAGAVVCLSREMLPIRSGVTAVPLGML
jgi:hypothetical protein